VITGINEGISSSNISIYPNPVRDRLNVVLPVEFKDISAVEVIDITGKTVLTSEFKSNHSLDVSSLTKGIYTLKVTAGDSVVQQKFMKE